MSTSLHVRSMHNGRTRVTAFIATWLRLICVLLSLLAVTALAAAAQTFQVQPHGVGVSKSPNTGPYQAGFTVIGMQSGSTYFTDILCTGSAINCSGPSQLTSSQSSVNLTYYAGAVGTGRIRLRVYKSGGTPSDSGWFNLTVSIPPPAPTPAPTASDQPLGDYRNPAMCVAQCFENVAAYSTPAYISMDVGRAAVLTYRSGSAHPAAKVLVDAVDNNPPYAVQYSLMLQDRNGFYVSFNNGGSGTQELFFADNTGGTVRLAGSFDASSYATGVESFTAVVKRWTSTTSFTSTSLPVWLIVLNEASSPYGAGWTIAGLQRLYFDPSPAGILTVDGTGGASFFRSSCSGSTCIYAGPAADASKLVQVGSTYQRQYPDGSYVNFRSDGTASASCDRFNNCTTYSFNTDGTVNSIVDPTNTAVQFAYTGSPATLSTISVPGGGSTRRVSTFTVTGGNLTQIQDPDNVYTSFSYDGVHRMTQTTDRRGKIWTTTYKNDGTVDSAQAPTVTVNTGQARPTTRYSAPSTQLIDSITRSGYGTSTKLVPRSIDLRGRVTTPRSYPTYFTVDNFSAPTLIQAPLSRTTSLARNGNGQVTYSRSPSGQAIVFKWNGPDLVSTYDSATTRRDTMIYEQTYHQLTSRSNGATKDSLYWSGGKLDSLDSGQPGPTYRTRFIYETIGTQVTGRVKTTTDPGGHVSAKVYATSGLRNLRADSIPGTSGSAPQVSRHGYDSAGRIVSDTDALGNVLVTMYDSLNRPVKRIGPGANPDTTIFVYDGLYLTTVTDAKGQVFRNAPNGIGWDTVRVDPLGHIDSLKYDLNGNVDTTVDRNLKRVSYQYDQLDNPTSRIAGSDTTTFLTDSLGRFVKVSNKESTDSTAFDAAGRTVAEVAKRGSVTYTRVSAYNAYSQRTSLIIASQNLNPNWADTARFHFNTLLQLDTLTDFSSGKTTITFNGDNQATGLQLPAPSGSPLSVTRNYPGEHTADQITYGDAGVNYPLGLYFTYSKLGQATQRLLAGQSTSTFQAGRDLTFDALGRVTGYTNWAARIANDNCLQPGLQVDPNTGQACYTTDSTTYGDQATYSYDKVGNRTDLGGNSPTGNRLQSFNGFTFTYDAAGNLTERDSSAHPIQKLYWDGLGRLDSVITTSDTIRFGYDALGRRIRKSTRSGSKYYLHDGDNLLAEVDGNGSRVAEYTSYPADVDQPQSMRRWNGGNATTYYYTTDFPGSVTGLVRSDGTLVSKYYYAPYGSLLSSDNYGPVGGPMATVDTVTNPLRFAAREFDAETGLYFMRARYYDPTVGRFISEDPAGISSGLNLYVYARNDPVDYVDPTGHDVHCPPGWSSNQKFSDDGTEDLQCKPSGNSGSGYSSWEQLFSDMGYNFFDAKYLAGFFSDGCGGGRSFSTCSNMVIAAILGLRTTTRSQFSDFCHKLGDVAYHQYITGNISWQPTDKLDQNGHIIDALTLRNWNTFFPHAFTSTSYLQGVIAHEMVHIVDPISRFPNNDRAGGPGTGYFWQSECGG